MNELGLWECFVIGILLVVAGLGIAGIVSTIVGG